MTITYNKTQRTKPGVIRAAARQNGDTRSHQNLSAFLLLKCTTEPSVQNHEARITPNIVRFLFLFLRKCTAKMRQNLGEIRALEVLSALVSLKNSCNETQRSGPRDKSELLASKLVGSRTN